MAIAGLLTGDSLVVTPAVRAGAHSLHRFGGSPIGNSRVKLTNAADCLKRGLIQPGQDPQRVAAEQLMRDGIDVLHTIGGDDTNMAAAALAAFLATNGYQLTVIGLPKTVDNDVHPIRQSLGRLDCRRAGRHVLRARGGRAQRESAHADRARGHGPRLRLAHRGDRARLSRPTRPEDVPPGARPFPCATRDPWRIPPRNAARLAVRGEAAARGHGSAGMRQRFRIGRCRSRQHRGARWRRAGETVPRDAFGHVKLDAVNPGAWFGKQFAAMIGAEKTLVQKSGYFARSAAANAADLALDPALH